MFRNLQALCRVSQRSISGSTRRSLKNRVSEHQKLFQEDNGLPVHLKAGAKDFLLFRLTMAITVFGASYSLYEIVKAAFPKKQN